MPTAVRLLAAIALLAIACVCPPRAIAQQPVDTELLTGLDLPVAFTFFGTDIMYVCERRGTVQVVQQGSVLPQPLLDISEEVGGWRDHGMLGMALDPAFATNGYIYLAYVVDRHHLLHHGTPSYSAVTNEYYAATITRVTRFTADATSGFTTTVPGSRLVLFGTGPGDGAPITYESHGACQIAFGRDGTLLVAVGDGASYLMPGDFGSSPVTYIAQAIADGILRPEEDVGAFRAQMLSSLSGKLLRLDAATGDGLPSNPFYEPGNPRSARSRIYSLGLRNPCRMTVRPGTGALDPALARPGSIYLGDVGWITSEELNVITRPGQNFGWPLYEGIDANAAYAAHPTENPDTPNPLAGPSGCNVTHLRFQDLLQQPADGHSLFFPNPCDPLQGIAPTTPTFAHTPPALDWQHTTDDARVPHFVSGALVALSLGLPGNEVAGAPFRGSCSMSGAWHSGLTFPPSFGPCFFLGDFGDSWIRRLEFDEHDELIAVHDFVPAGRPMMLAENPADHGLVYVGLSLSQFRAIRFGIEPPPLSVPVADVTHGTGPLLIHLDARASSDPEGQPLTYSWQLGNGQTSTAAQLGLQLPGNGGTPLLHPVQLTVTDPFGQIDVETLQIAIDNTPPQVEITSFANGDRYSLVAPTTLTLAANVTDAEHGPTQLSYEWRTALHHNTHVHPEPPDPLPTTSTSVSPTPADGEFFAYTVDLTVTDAGGLATTRRHWLFADTTGASTSVLLTSPAPGARIAPGDDVTFSAITTGSVQHVEYYVEGELVGAAYAPPWTANWTPTYSGEVTAMALAIATDATSSNTGGIAFAIEVPTFTNARVRQSTADAVEPPMHPRRPQATGTGILLGDDGTPWYAGLQFEVPDLPYGARIQRAWIEFTAARTDASPSSLQIAFDQAPLPRAIGNRTGDLHDRVTGATLAWAPGPWILGESGTEQRTPDLAALLTPRIASPKWNHRLVAIVHGTGERLAMAYDGDPLVAPVLRIEWLPPLAQGAGAPVDADAAEDLTTGAVDTTDWILALGESGGAPQRTAIRCALKVEPGRQIHSAHLQLTAAAVDTGPAEFVISAESIDDAAAIVATPFDLSLRTAGKTTVRWFPGEWLALGDAGAAQRSPDLSSVLQEIVDRPGWQSGQHVLLLIEGTGARSALSTNNKSLKLPQLEIAVER